MDETFTSSPSVSVIVPVRNSAPYLRQCLDSITGQTLSEIEIIIVDDGSTDESPAILREYAEKDARIRIITREGGSVGAARNRGFDEASGQYVIFWDSDDWFEPDALECMYRICTERDADLCICDARDFDDATGLDVDHNYVRKPYPETDVFSAKDCPDRIFNITSTVCWNKMVRRRFLLDEDIRFPEGRLIEDTSVSMLELLLAGRIAVCPKRLIHYRSDRDGSLLRNYAWRSAGLTEGCREALRTLSERGLLEDEQIFRSFLDKVAGLYLFTLPVSGNYEQYRDYYEQVLLSGDGLLQKWDPAWEPMPDVAKYLEARQLRPEEYLLKLLQKKTLQERKQRTRARGLETELKARKKEYSAAEKQHLSREKKLAAENERLQKRLDTVLNSKSFRAARILSAPFRWVRKIFSRKKKSA